MKSNYHKIKACAVPYVHNFQRAIEGIVTMVGLIFKKSEIFVEQRVSVLNLLMFRTNNTVFVSDNLSMLVVFLVRLARCSDSVVDVSNNLNLNTLILARAKNEVVAEAYALDNSLKMSELGDTSMDDISNWTMENIGGSSAIYMKTRLYVKTKAEPSVVSAKNILDINVIMLSEL